MIIILLCSADVEIEQEKLKSESKFNLPVVWIHSVVFYGTSLALEHPGGREREREREMDVYLYQLMTGAYPFNDKRSPSVLYVVVRMTLKPETKILQHGRLPQGKLGGKKKHKHDITNLEQLSCAQHVGYIQNIL